MPTCQSHTVVSTPSPSAMGVAGLRPLGFSKPHARWGSFRRRAIDALAAHDRITPPRGADLAEGVAGLTGGAMTTRPHPHPALTLARAEDVINPLSKSSPYRLA